MKRMVPMLAAGALVLSLCVAAANAQNDDNQLPPPKPVPGNNPAAPDLVPPRTQPSDRTPEVSPTTPAQTETAPGQPEVTPPPRELNAPAGETTAAPAGEATAPGCAGPRGRDVRFPCARRLLALVTYQPVEPGWHNAGCGCHDNGFPPLYTFFLCSYGGYGGCGCNGGCNNDCGTYGNGPFAGHGLPGLLPWRRY